MILENLQHANQSINNSVNLVQIQNSLREYESQLDSLKAVTSSLSSRILIAEKLRSKDLVAPYIPENTQKTVLEALEKCGEKSVDKSLDASAVLALKNASELLKNVNDNTLKVMAAQRYSKPVELLLLFRNLLLNQKEADEIIEVLNKAKTTPPTNVKTIEQTEEKYKKAEQLIAQINVSDDTEIVSFLEKVKENQATISDLTPKIISWLKEKDLSNRIKLSFGYVGRG